MMGIDDTVQQHEQRISRLEVEVEDVKKTTNTLCEDFRTFMKPEGSFDQLKAAVNKMSGSNDALILLIKWVILPLIVIVGALVGIKIAWPSI
jgi:hypothetical protein